MINILKTLSFILIGTSLNAQTEVYNEDFESGIPATYTIVDNDGNTPNVAVAEYTDAWIGIVDPDNDGNHVAASTSYFEPIGEASRWLITPAISLGAFGNILYWDARSHDPSFPDGYRILVSRTDTQLASFTDTVYLIFQEIAKDWQTRSANLSNVGLDNETVHIAFINETDNGFKLYIDNIRVEMEDPVGLNETTKAIIKVFPNPTTDVITVTGMENIKSISIYSLDGKMVLNSNENKVSLQNLAAGKYIVEVTSDAHILRSTVIKR